MYIYTQVPRGRGWESVSRSVHWVEPDRLHVEEYVEGSYAVTIEFEDKDKTKLGTAVTINLAEVRAIVKFLRSKGIEIDPLREKQRKLADVLARSFGEPPTEVLLETP
jgi:hypothetical protein